MSHGGLNVVSESFIPRQKQNLGQTLNTENTLAQNMSYCSLKILKSVEPK